MNLDIDRKIIQTTQKILKKSTMYAKTGFLNDISVTNIAKTNPKNPIKQYYWISKNIT